MEVMFDYTKLRSRIKEVFGTQDQYAKALGLGRVSVSQSLNNQREFSAGEMLRSVSPHSQPAVCPAFAGF